MWSSDPTIISTTVVVGSSAGINTASITCTTPLSAIISATVTIALSIITPLSLIETINSVPFNVIAIIPSDRSVESTEPDTTWWVRIAVNRSMSASTASRVPSGNASKAASVGANTVNGPSAERASTKPAAITAVSKVLWSSDPTIISTTVVVGSWIGLTIIDPVIPCRACVPTEQS